jgi:Zn-dependent peptidase ImmA (M78 family)
MTVIDPGLMFINQFGQINSAQDVLAYADFLRKESCQDSAIPVDLSLIFKRFHIPSPIQKPLPGQQGLLIDAKNGIVIINSNDPTSRQKFSQAHELVEFLFNSLPNGKDIGNGWKLKKPGGFSVSMKEYLCNWTAANLLIPPTYVHNQIMQHGANFDCARIISNECEISLSAALIQVARISRGNHSVVLWIMKNKPSEIKRKVPTAQLGLFNDHKPQPVMKLRVEWSLGSENALYIPKDKSVEETSLIFQAWQTGILTSGKERLCLDGKKLLWFQTDNQPFSIDGGTKVLSLIEHLRYEKFE